MNRSLIAVSRLPGRVRWEVPALRRNRTLAFWIETNLTKGSGIHRVEANPVTGRVLVFFQASLRATEVERALAKVVGQFLAFDSTALADLRAEIVRRFTRIGNGNGDDDHHHHHHGDLEVETAARLRHIALGGGSLAALGVRRLIPGMMLATAPVAAAVTVGVTLITGAAYLRGAWRAIRRRRANTDLLVSTAILTSIVLRESGSALLVVWLLNVGEYMQLRIISRTRSAIRELLEGEQDEVWAIVDGQEVLRPLREIAPGDLIVVHGGHRLPADGRITFGTSALNEAPITGEAMPVVRGRGDSVFAGSLVVSGRIGLCVERIGNETVVGRLLEAIEEARQSRAPIQTIGERFSSRFVPASFLLAALVLAATGDVYRSLAILLIACPCAAGLSTPTAVSAAVDNAARRGILIKGGRPLEMFARIDTVVIDKTGTLTTGSSAVEHVVPVADGWTEERVLALAANAELHSDHPIAAALVARARERGLDIGTHETCEVVPGHGVVCTNGSGTPVVVGNEQLLQMQSIPVPDEAASLVSIHSAAAETMMYVADNGVVVGVIGVRDRARPEAREAIAALRRLGVRRVIMLTGDAEAAAAAVARTVGVEEWRSRQMPEEKYAHIHALRARGHRVAMVGDGINDAPALAAADVGVAMGTAGSDIAIETADIALASDDLSALASTLRLSERAMSVIRQNYAISLAVNTGGIVIGAAGLLVPIAAALLHNVSTLMVVMNSARLVGFDASPDGALSTTKSRPWPR